MKVSYNWLQSFFDKPLPSPEEVERLFTFHAFEVDSTEQVGVSGFGADTIFDIKVLANRAHDCLSHLGLARELAAMLKWSRPNIRTFSAINHTELPDYNLVIEVREPDHCSRYLGLVMQGVKIGPSPDWLVQRLASIGQRSINSVVDAANFVMFDLGQPMHVFDADKVKGKLRLRLAEKEESIITLDDKELFLAPGMLIEADEIGPLAIAGIKGGKRAEVTAETKNIIIVAGTFQAGKVRKTATTLGLRTDALKRFENGLVPELALFGIEELTGLVSDLCGQSLIKTGHMIDVYPQKRELKNVEFTVAQINELLGLKIAESEMLNILASLGIVVVKRVDVLLATPPIERRDLENIEDLVEEVGRLYGYEHVPSIPLPDFKNSNAGSEIFADANKVREVLVGLGFTEAYGYSFVNAGEVELINPPAGDKAFLRTNLLDGLKDKTALNLKNLLFDTEAVRLFVVGKVFINNKELWRLGASFAYRVKNKNFKNEVEDFINQFCLGFSVKLAPAEVLAIPGLVVSRVDGESSFYIELDLAILAGLPRESVVVNLDHFITSTKFITPSIFPSIVRDIAVWADPGIMPVSVADIIKKEAGDLCVKGPILFDLFEKKNSAGFVEKKSLAFRLVFQSFDRTLSIEEVNQIMERVTANLESLTGFEVRK